LKLPFPSRRKWICDDFLWLGRESRQKFAGNYDEELVMNFLRETPSEKRKINWPQV